MRIAIKMEFFICGGRSEGGDIGDGEGRVGEDESVEEWRGGSGGGMMVEVEVVVAVEVEMRLEVKVMIDFMVETLGNSKKMEFDNCHFNSSSRNFYSGRSFSSSRRVTSSRGVIRSGGSNQDVFSSRGSGSSVTSWVIRSHNAKEVSIQPHLGDSKMTN
ncbi:hypothetical protein Glove_232g133 [Diversispora epigaea]|uniref:Uncharacterized protein n=1 Tax=Diversispora epigaea TaxID=1348612 RepID=A0A397IHH6_9GLOM|nr:hypothetical protein Glove_232g133 [Diversispora epigaea]